MSSNGGRRIHHLRPAIGPRLAETAVNASSEANGNVPRNVASAAISQAIVDLVRTRTGRAPTTAKTEMTSNLAVVTLSGGLTVPEKTLVDEGHGALTVRVRNTLYQGMRAEAVAAVEAITGRQVAAYLADQHDHDLAMIALLFEPPVG